MPPTDPFDSIAHYYDTLMDHVNYPRWARITYALGDLFEHRPAHLDVACGTGVLVQHMRQRGWKSFGIDLSAAMVRTGRKRAPMPLAVGDMRALPAAGGVHFITCLFDSLNFLLTEEDVVHTLQSFHAALDTPGLVYFDIVTERMVTSHFANQSWEEDNGSFTTVWRSEYVPGTGIADSLLRFNTGPEHRIRERIYPVAFVTEALTAAGFNVLGVFDADTWRKPRRRSTRIDFVAAKGNPQVFGRGFKSVRQSVSKLL
ncbi:MAG: class I SAM-dependent DNA methyltransferase [Candidatus Hydrogenedentota bacterium]